MVTAAAAGDMAVWTIANKDLEPLMVDNILDDTSLTYYYTEMVAKLFSSLISFMSSKEVRQQHFLRSANHIHTVGRPTAVATPLQASCATKRPSGQLWCSC